MAFAELGPLEGFALTQTSDEAEDIEHFLSPSGLTELLCDQCGSSDIWCEAVTLSKVLVEDGIDVIKSKDEKVMLIRPLECKDCGCRFFNQIFLEEI